MCLLEIIHRVAHLLSSVKQALFLIVHLHIFYLPFSCSMPFGLPLSLPVLSLLPTLPVLLSLTVLLWADVGNLVGSDRPATLAFNASQLVPPSSSLKTSSLPFLECFFLAFLMVRRQQQLLPLAMLHLNF